MTSMTDDEIVGPAGRGASRRRFLKRVIAAGAAVSAPGSPFGGPAEAQGAARISGFDHVAVPMRDTEAMVAFYRALGFTVNEGARICSVHFGDHKINLHRPALWQGEAFTLRAPAAEPPCGDFCFVWDGTPAALEARLEQVGAAVIEGPADRQGGRDGGRATGASRYVRDPDGNLLEFIIYS